MIYFYSGILVIYKENEIMKCAGKLMGHETIILSVLSQIQEKSTECFLSFVEANFHLQECVPFGMHI